VCNTDINIPRGRSKPNKYMESLMKKRSQTPKMYYRGSFDVNLQSPSKKKHRKVNRTPVAIAQVGLVDKVKAAIKLEKKRPVIEDDDINDYDREPVIGTSHFQNDLETPISMTDGYEMFKARPPKVKANDRQPSPLKAFTGSFYKNTKPNASRKSSEEMIPPSGASKYGFDINIAGKIQSILQTSKINNHAMNLVGNENKENT